MDLVDETYVAVRDFPKWELFGLSQQMRAAAVSIPSLIAEGRGRYTVKDQQHFYREARGSIHEQQTQVEIARRQQFINAEQARHLTKRTDQVGQLISGLLRSMKD